MARGRRGPGFDSRPRHLNFQRLVISCFQVAIRLKYRWSDVNPQYNQPLQRFLSNRTIYFRDVKHSSKIVIMRIFREPEVLSKIRELLNIFPNKHLTFLCIVGFILYFLYCYKNLTPQIFLMFYFFHGSFFFFWLFFLSIYFIIYFFILSFYFF